MDWPNLFSVALPAIELGSAGLVLACIAYIFSCVWLIPCFLYGFTFYVPIFNNNSLLGHHDDYFYYTRIKKIADGDLFNSDPIVRQFSARGHVHCTSQLSYAAGGLFAFKNKNILHAFMANTVVFPLLHFSLIFLFALLITQQIAASLLVVALVAGTAEMGSLRRFPNFMFTGIHMMLLGIFCLVYFSPHFSAVLAVLFVPVVGLAPVISPPNMIFAALLTVVIMLFDISRAFSHVSFFLASGLLGCVCAYYSYQHSKSAAALFHFAHFDTASVAWMHLKKAVFRYILPSCFIIPAACLFANVNRHALFCILLASLLTPSLLYLGTYNLDLVRRTISRGCGELTMVTGYAVLLAWPAYLPPAWLPWSARLLVPLLSMAALVLIFRLARREGQKVRKLALQAINPPLRTLIDWSGTLSKNDIILTLDFDLGINLPVYTPAYFYIPQAIQSTATEQEIWDLFENACAVLRVPPAEYLRLLTELPPPYPTTDPVRSQASNATRMLTYGLYYQRWHLRRIFTDEEIRHRYVAYKKRLATGEHFLEKVTVLLVSRRQIIHKTLFAKLEASGLPALFRNGEYAAYTISPSLIQVLRS